MPIDAYSPCPGGTGKKVKFCCGDFLPELEKIDRMIEGEQYLACLSHIDLLLTQKTRECLLATKCSLLRATGQFDAARETAAFFVEKHPENQVALAESAMVAAGEDSQAALDFVLKAIHAAKGLMLGQTYQALGVTAGALLHDGFSLPARALLQMQCDVAEQDNRPREALASLSQTAGIPLLLRDDSPLPHCPADAPYKEQFDKAIETVASADWHSAADQFSAITAEHPNATIAWRTLATLRGWLTDNAGCIEALRKYAALRETEEGGFDDAVEAEALAMFLADDPLGDRLGMFGLEWTVRDVERFQELLLSSPQVQSMPFDPAKFSNGETPPPKAMCVLLDRPLSESAEGLTIDTIPQMLAHTILFGRQTDREARFLVMSVAENELRKVTDLVNGFAGDAVDPNPQKTASESWSASQKALRALWLPPKNTKPEQFRALTDQHRRDAVTNKWPELKLGALDGLSLREAAADEKYKVRLAAALLVLEHWLERMPDENYLSELRTKLGLPDAGPIDLNGRSIHELPTIRFKRLNAESPSDDDLIEAYWRTGAFAMRAAMRTFALAIVARPSLADSNDRIHAFATLARTEDDIPRALEYINQGRTAGEAKKESSASWDLMELSLRFAQQEGQEVFRLIEHIQNNHLEEPGIGEALMRMLVEVGLLRPDGTPAFDPNGPMPAEAEASDPGGLWTPESAAPSGGGKLWTPE